MMSEMAGVCRWSEEKFYILSHLRLFKWASSFDIDSLAL